MVSAATSSNSQFEEGTENRMPAYDGGNYLWSNLEDKRPQPTFAASSVRAWVGSSLLNDDYEMLSPEGLIPNDVHPPPRCQGIRKWAQRKSTPRTTTTVRTTSGTRSTFSTKNVATLTQQDTVLTSVLDVINVVPNPYYAFSQYETSKLDNRVGHVSCRKCAPSASTTCRERSRSFSKADPLPRLIGTSRTNATCRSSGVYIITSMSGIGDTQVVRICATIWITSDSARDC